tara:strand:- start:341 stop:697 length:357 start_codon:yes stop_codon:yes gene_type:complete
MSHFAKITDGLVETVIVAEQDFVDSLPGTWVQTSYNTKGAVHYDPNTGEVDDLPTLRFNYASIGDVYDAVRDAFIAPSPYPSWVIDEATCRWKAPSAYPDDGKIYEWDEDSTAWVEIE